MKLGEFILEIVKHPELMNLDVNIVTMTETVQGGELDGAVDVDFSALESVTAVGNVLLFWPSGDGKKRQRYMPNLENWQKCIVVGPVPPVLKYETER